MAVKPPLIDETRWDRSQEPRSDPGIENKSIFFEKMIFDEVMAKIKRKLPKKGLFYLNAARYGIFWKCLEP